MEFNKLVSGSLELIFQKYKLYLAEQYKNYVKFKSEHIIITVSHDDRENSNSLYVGKNENSLYPIDENVLKDVFNSTLKINYVTMEVFINNLTVFFEGEGQPLIVGNAPTLKRVEEYVNIKSNEYTMELVNKQHFDAANKAWEAGKFKDFIKYLDKIDRKQLPSSYELKYKIAHQKLK